MTDEQAIWVAAVGCAIISIFFIWIGHLIRNAPYLDEPADDLTDGRIRNTPPVAAGLNDDGRNTLHREHNG